MYDRDYLMRLINQTSVMLARIMGLKEQQKPEQALEEIDEFLGKELRMRARLALGLSDSDLIGMLSVGGVPNPEMIGTLAAFLHEEGDLLRESGRANDSLPRYEKSFRLIVHVLATNGPIDGLKLEERAETLLAKLAPYEAASTTKRAAWSWLELSGKYADAENALYELFELKAVTSEEGNAFYDRLSELADETLAAGGLPRAELDDGREQWNLLAGETAS
ncbi:DUF6483 family protein [Cohnella algarum]|uniref:DUF6483 family protein n=1 Tax=Cohnella algarum TaxID=2044859 RepID=UPI00196869EE|nr:DUF6483 family protein [Cohnella algarum]MBN2982610.1 hypothetical protein [Cohnella algarum]